jgi:predicted nucleic acid-binding protein
VIVVDASALLELLLNRPAGEPLAQRMVTEPPEPLAAPHLLDVEVGQGLRRFERRGELDESTLRGALEDLAALPITRYPHTPLLPRALELRANATVYDAVYLALAEVLPAVLLTGDAALAAIPGCRAEVEVLSG